jgi:methyltransferase-like protein/2-polyprenyl-3-methyl-5-hydroxy-6-metoxy-1,4-benzoquinol methylase
MILRKPYGGLMPKNISVEQTSNNTYDEVPYESRPYPASHPAHLRTMGLLFGMTPVSLEKARILELGCAGGGNITPLAMAYPNAECVGVDLSKVQIDLATKQAQDLGLKNMDFRNSSITDIDEKSYGKFDYIICHGVLSWVPENIQTAVFDVCGKLLTPNGLAYISYNTLPGWNMVRSIRDMMLYHSENFKTLGEKVQQSRLLLDFVKDSLEGSNTPYGDMLKKETELLAQQPDHYLRHDHLGEDNKQYYFNEFMKEAAARKLQYLGDSNLSSMFLGNMPSKVVEKLQAVNDIVRTEQYMDFINNRRFRATILCRNDVALNRALNIDTIKKFLLGFKLVPAKPMAEVKLNDANEKVEFYFNGVKEAPVSTTSPIMKAVLYTFAENWGHPLSFNNIVKLAGEKLPSAKAADIEQELTNNAMRMVLSGHITIFAEDSATTNTISAKPKVLDIVRYQAEHMPTLWVTNGSHERLGINIFEKFAFRYMDGKNSVEELTAKMLEHVKNGDLVVNKDNKKLEDEKQIKIELSAMLTQTLERTKACSILVD